MDNANPDNNPKFFEDVKNILNGAVTKVSNLVGNIVAPEVEHIETNPAIEKALVKYERLIAALTAKGHPVSLNEDGTLITVHADPLYQINLDQAEEELLKVHG